MTDAVPDNWIARSLFWEIPWSFGLGGITVYLVGIAQTISQSSSAAGWLPSPLIVDITGFIALFGPLICGVSFAIGAGAAAENNLIGTAETLIRVSYMLWFVWVASIGGAVLYASIRLVRVLESHHRKFRQGGSFATVISGIYRIQLMAASFIICLWTFAAILLLYCALRDQIMANIVGSIFIGATWSILGSFTTLIALISVLVSPNMRNNPALRSNNLTNGTSNYTTSTHPDPRGYGDSTIGAMTATSQDDTEAILYAIEANGREEQWNSQQGQLNKSKKPWNNFLSASTPSRRGSNASSQLELTSYEQDQVEALPHYR
ncbi:hypothetical protein BDB00DRAFT_950538 [Zychaea mexicana]|uniref:uncharacterized protein n=1 Tax=Zychaea mexicana TaxID=64656 RepID=UPI0022FF0D53|nr:uncharacterized protein BDB00DRAFT_950538 [Zychaea mexicana]KAI9498116.1 hypothetical protein BDB00DRAFT_950538 [Zychaea mexicana]